MESFLTATLRGPVVREVVEVAVAVAGTCTDVVLSVAAADCAAGDKPSEFDDVNLGSSGSDAQALVMLAASNPIPATADHLADLRFIRDTILSDLRRAGRLRPSYGDPVEAARVRYW